jgi:type VI secretion system protein ImpJ
LFGTEARDDFDTIKIAELRRAAGGGFELSNEFIPTAMRLSGAPLLRTWTSDLLSAMLTKRRLVVEALAQVDKSRVEFSAQDVTRYLQLGAINRHIPLIRHYSKSNDSSPFTLYTALASFAGQLTTFSAQIVPEELPTYSHDDMRETFVELFEKLRQLLDLAMQENFIEVPLEARRDGMWIGMLKDPRLADCPTYVVAVEANAPQQEVSNRVPQLSKIASWKQVPRIVHSAIPGAPLTSTHRPPPQIPIRPQSVYFLVDTKHEYWEQILREKTVAIYLPPPFDPSRAKVKLMAIPDTKRSH